jgi:imidazolonepropionase-like amidohydrolase
VAVVANAQVPVPAAEQEEAILLKGGFAHLGNGRVIKNSLIAFDDGKITVVADATTSKLDIVGYQVIDISGQHVYPGFILPNSQVGLQEVSAVRAMNDNDETGALNPNVRSLVAYNTDSELPATFRFNGILMAETTPTGGRISGTSSVMNMDGWNWQDAVHSADVGIHMNWPRKQTREFDFTTFTVKTEPNKEYDSQVAELKTLFDAAASYAGLSIKQRNLKLEAMQGLYDGSKALFVHTADPKEIIDGVNFAKDNGVERVVLVAGTDALMVKAFLKENKIPVVVQSVHSMPSRPGMDVDLPYRLPALLTDAGVMVSLSHTGMLSHARDLPFYAGTAVAYGMDKEAALQTITSNTAEILGIDDKVGTLQEGKEATLFVSVGDALDIRTNKLTLAFIQGKTIVLDNKQQELYKRYSKKYGHID